MNYALLRIREVAEEKDVKKVNQLIKEGWLLIAFYTNDVVTYVLGKPRT